MQKFTQFVQKEKKRKKIKIWISVTKINNLQTDKLCYNVS